MSDKLKDEFIEALIKLMNEKAEVFGLDKNAFSNDKELIKDMFSDSQELVESARKLHSELLDNATRIVRDITIGQPLGIEALQQLIIVYYRLRDSFLYSLLQLENEFYAYIMSQMKTKPKK